MPSFIEYRSKYFHSPLAYVAPFRVGVNFDADEIANNAAADASTAEDAKQPGGIIGKLIFPLQIIILIICS